MDHGYLIGLLKPSQVIPAAHLLREFDLSPVVPLYKKIVRVGAERRKEQRTFQVLPGVIFIYSDDAPMAQGLLAPVNMRVTWMKDSLTGSPALCQAWQIKPLFDWASAQAKGEKSEVRNPAPLRLHVGQSVWVKDGPFAGRKGTLLRGATDPTHVIVQLEANGLRVEIPRDMVVTVKTSCAPS